MAKEYKASFLYVGDHINPIYISEKLQITPSRLKVKGSYIRVRDGKRCANLVNLWELDRKIDPKRSLQDHINDLITILFPKKNEITELFNLGYMPCFYCGIFTGRKNTDISLDDKTIRQISELHAKLKICYYNEKNPITLNSRQL